MTIGNVKRAMARNPYNLFRHGDGDLIGVNSRILSFSKQLKQPESLQTNLIGFIPCSFQEYITHKTPFK